MALEDDAFDLEGYSLQHYKTLEKAAFTSSSCDNSAQVSKKKVDAETRQECETLLFDHLAASLGMPVPDRLETASFDNVLDVLQNGVYGDSAPHFKSSRERDQLALTMMICSAIAARPGEVAVSAGYKVVNEGLRWRDFDFALHRLADGAVVIKVDIQVRNLKGLRNDVKAYRIQPIYEDVDMPFVADAARLAFSMALEDDAFNLEGYSLQHYKTLEEAAFTSSPANNTFQLKLPIRESIQSAMVIRKHSKEGGEWNLLPEQGAFAGDMQGLLSKIGKRLGYQKFTFQSIRRDVASSLNDPNVTAEDAHRAIGHKPSSTIWEKHYVAKRTTVDLQGLYQRGQERRELVNDKATVVREAHD